MKPRYILPWIPIVGIIWIVLISDYYYQKKKGNRTYYSWSAYIFGDRFPSAFFGTVVVQALTCDYLIIHYLF